MDAVFRIWRGDANGGEFTDYKTAVTEGMVVLDAVHQIQAERRPTTWPCAGTARPASAARARPKSTACRS
jgi:succinate dehydrogenase / fumarate reductase iron-sulfur subunit